MNKEKNIDVVCSNKYDVLVTFASFEDRSTVFSEKLNIENIDKVFVLHNIIENKHTMNNVKKIKHKFETKCIQVPVNLSEPIYTADIINELIIKECGNKKVLIDITTFTHEVLLMLLRMLRDLVSVENICCVYSRAIDYCEGDLVEDKWLSKGVREVRTVLGYPGDIKPLKKTRMIVIVGYEYERAFDIISEIEPSALSLGYVEANEATTEKNQHANSHYLSLVEQMAISYSDIEKFTISCGDVFKTKNILEELIISHEDENLIIVPLNNKVSTVGVALATFNHPNVQICYGESVIYNQENYSSVGDKFYCFDLDFNS